jgi:hypothetical protein
MVTFNWPAILVSAIFPLLFGAIWYSAPIAKLFTSYKGEHKHKPIVYIICYLAGIPLAMVLTGIMSAHDLADQHAVHGLLHGSMLGVFAVLPVLLVHFLFEGDRSVSNMVYHILYWIISIGLIGTLVFGWA